ncbi:UNVERIFIED_CONTAM: hypothetical protein Sradi_3247500 [Sesamum radiatum]|uniref:Retrotransposon gag domain-containing protein n=1 Tax=Sesamum radiatum TaxID=300843 RepID=A0AAW2QZP0_SESRA
MLVLGFGFLNRRPTGARDAKEVENFLFDIEQYFLAANVEDEARKVSTTTMYLTGDAKLWWCIKYAEIQANQVRLDTWALLQEAICEQFFMENVEYNARRALQKLEHTGFMRDYVKSFSTLMLDIRDMSEKDKLFTFMEGLKPWSRLELRRQRASLVKPMELQASASGGNDSEEDEDNLGAISQWCNKLSHQVAAKKTVPPQAGKTAPALIGSHYEEEAQPRNLGKKGLMFIDVKIYSELIRAMIDTRTTYNYLASAKVERLGLVLEKGVGRVKAINSATQSIAGEAKSVLIKVGPFEGKTNLSVVVVDDFKLILGLEFLRDTRTAVLPHVDSL